MADPVLWTSYEQLERKIGPRRALELFDDDGDGSVASGADADAVEEAVASANDEVTSMLLQKGYSLDQLEVLAEDASLRRYATSILAQISGERKTEFLNAENKGPFDAFGERARKALTAMARGDLRSRKEDEAGANPIVGADTNTATPVFIFSRDPRSSNRSGPGGF